MQRTAFNEGWTFFRNDSPQGRPVTLPHDAMIHAPRTADAPSTGEQGNFHGGTYRYEKSFLAPANPGRTILQFGGVYRRAHVLLNDREVAAHAYGWTPFFVDLTEDLLPGQENLLVVTCDNVAQPDSRWYTGAGIFRPVWLWEGGARCIEPEGVRIRTLSAAPARIEVNVDADDGDVQVELLDGNDVVASGWGNHLELTVPDARLWSADDPHLYRWHVTLNSGSDVLDECWGTFGIREITWSTDGLFVNGERTLLRGGCIHADCGILGAAAEPAADRRRVRMLKEAGYNAIRSAHNPASDATVEACDEYGIYLMDEGWDQWFWHKNPFDYADEWRDNHLADLDAMVARDFNHPSVIMWSIGNEVSEPSCEEGLNAIDEMVEHLHAADPSRPVTCGINLAILGSAASGRAIYNAEGDPDADDNAGAGLNSTTFNALTQAIGTAMNHMADLPSYDRACSPALDRLDIAGYNYARGRYALERRAHPGRIIVGSETFHADVVRNWRAMQRLPYLVGDFTWSAWDYLGEAGCGAWSYGDADTAFQKSYPWLLAYQGAIDICGQPNAELFLAQAAWGHTTKSPLITVRPLGQGAKASRAIWRFSNGIPSWSWSGCQGERATIEVFCDAPVVELRLNGRSISRKNPRDCICRWSVPYEPGELTATALTARGEALGSTTLRSAGAPRIRMRAEAFEVAAGGIVFVDVTIADEEEIVESLDDRLLSAKVEGGELLAFGSARPRTEERYDTGMHTTFQGHAQAIVRLGADGTARLRVRDQLTGEKDVLTLG